MSIWEEAPKNSRLVFEHLKFLAERMRVASYGEIAEAVGRKAGHKVPPVGLGLPLGFIRDQICRKQGLPWINSLAVNADTWLPGDSFLPADVAFGEDERVLWRGMVLAVFAYPWSEIAIE